MKDEHFGDGPRGTVVKWAFLQVRASGDGASTSPEDAVIWPESAAVIFGMRQVGAPALKASRISPLQALGLERYFGTRSWTS